MIFFYIPFYSNQFAILNRGPQKIVFKIFLLILISTFYKLTLMSYQNKKTYVCSNIIVSFNQYLREEPRIIFQVGNIWVQIDFLIAGDGPKRILLEEVIEKHNLQQRYHQYSASYLRSKAFVFNTYSLFNEWISFVRIF